MSPNSNSEKAFQPLDRIQTQSFLGGSSGQRIDYRPFSNEHPIAEVLFQSSKFWKRESPCYRQFRFHLRRP